MPIPGHKGKKIAPLVPSSLRRWSRDSGSEMAEAVAGLKMVKQAGVDQSVAEAYARLPPQQIEELAAMVTGVPQTGKPPPAWGGRVRYKKGGPLASGQLEAQRRPSWYGWCG